MPELHHDTRIHLEHYPPDEWQVKYNDGSIKFAIAGLRREDLPHVAFMFLTIVDSENENEFMVKWDAYHGGKIASARASFIKMSDSQGIGIAAALLKDYLESAE